MVDSLNTTYDYQSVMQYSKTAFGINGNVTMDPKQCGVFQLGQRVGFTQTDSKQAHMLYKCNGTVDYDSSWLKQKLKTCKSWKFG